MTTATRALRDARHELDSLGGLWVTDSEATTEDNPHTETWQIDTTKTVNKIEQALAVCERSLAERIETAFDKARQSKAVMQQSYREIEAAEETAKMDNLDEWTGAKNNDVRRAIILRELAQDDDYHNARKAYQGARDTYRLDLLEIKRLELLVEDRKAGGE